MVIENRDPETIVEIAQEGVPGGPNHDLHVSNNHPASRRRAGDAERWLTDALLLICLMATVAAKCIIPAAGMDEDFWWHVSTGDWILSHHAVPLRDVFSTYTMNSPWIAYTWLFDVLSSAIYRSYGLHGVLTLTTVLTLSFVAAVVLLLSQYGRMLRAIALGGLVFAASGTIVTPRPWLFTCLFFVVELYMLLQARTRGRAAWLFPIPLLFALWANLHIQFVYGLGVIGLFALEHPIATLWKWPSSGPKLRAGLFWALLAASTAATLLNPYGWRLYLVVAQYATQSVPLQVVKEMQAMQFRNVTDWSVLFLACGALLTIGGSRRRCPLMMALLVVSLWFGFHTQRDGWFLAVVSALVMVYTGDPAEPGMQRIRLRQWMIALPVSTVLAFAVLSSAAVSPGALLDAALKRFPIKASDYIQAHALQGPLYNSYSRGGYLTWRLPGMPVSIDGRANLHGDARLARAAVTWMGAETWAEDPELMRARTVLLERASGLASVLRSDSRFRLVYQDEVSSVFLHSDGSVPNRFVGEYR
jgi:hypothetical protein